MTWSAYCPACLQRQPHQKHALDRWFSVLDADFHFCLISPISRNRNEACPHFTIPASTFLRPGLLSIAASTFRIAQSTGSVVPLRVHFSFFKYCDEVEKARDIFEPKTLYHFSLGYINRVINTQGKVTKYSCCWWDERTSQLWYYGAGDIAMRGREGHYLYARVEHGFKPSCSNGHLEI